MSWPPTSLSDFLRNSYCKRNSHSDRKQTTFCFWDQTHFDQYLNQLSSVISYLHENEKWFPYQRLSTYPRFETEARGNSEMASYCFVFCLRTTDLACNQLKTHPLVGKTKARAANLKSLLFTSNASIDSCVCSAEFGSTGNPFLTAYSCAPWPTSILWGEFSITCLATASGFATL